MRREDAKQILPLLQAWAEGETIQIKTDDGWEDLEKDELPIEDMAEFRRVSPQEQTERAQEPLLLLCGEDIEQ